MSTRAKQEGDPEPKTSQAPQSQTNKGDATGFGLGVYAILLVGGGLAYFAYQYLQANSEKQ